MSASSSQLDDIYRQLRERFTSHPVISVRPTKGDPPDQYEITYTITGMSKTDDGRIAESIDHMVELAIPFGFPHFPPSCKPKSNIFHPDFDPAAICLGDFWEQDRDLPALLIHIGEMINGEIYSTSNAFNEEAAEWYLDNAAKFPFTNINWDNESSDSHAANHRHVVDTLDDSDIAPEFDFLAMEDQKEDDDITLNTSFPDVDFPDQIDLNPFIQLDKQKKYYALLKSAQSITAPPPKLVTLRNKANEEIDRAEKLHRDGKKFENKGDAQIAYEKYQQILAIVADFPSIEADIHRIKQTLALLADISPVKSSDQAAPAVPAEAPIENGLKLRRLDATSTPPKKTPGRPANPQDLFLPKDHKKSRLPLYLMLGLAALIIGAGGYFWYSFTSKLSNAEAAYAECSTAMANNQFQEAKRSCENALQLISGVKFIQKDFARQLEKFIQEVLHSDKLTKGLAGYVLLDGKYIPIAETKNLQAVKMQLEQADNLYAASKWQQAAQQYQILLPQIERNAYFDQQTIDDVHRKLRLATFKMYYDPARAAMEKKDWEMAIDQLLKAQEVLVDLPEAEREQYSAQLQHSLQKSQFANLKEQGDLSFTGTDWLSAIAAYNQALASGQKTALPPESIAAIKNNIKRAELYNAINKGNKAFAAASWDEAIEAYSNARDLLVGNKKTFPGQDDKDANVLKLDRIILQAKIIRDRQTIQTLLKEKALSKARRVYQQILTGIAKSPFRMEEEFSTISAEINKAMLALDKKMYLDSKQAYLEDHYQALFVTNYPTANTENLSNPIITFAKETPTKLVFKMQCTENDGGRPLNMVMFYGFDKKTGQWGFYTDK